MKKILVLVLFTLSFGARADGYTEQSAVLTSYGNVSDGGFISLNHIASFNGLANSVFGTSQTSGFMQMNGSGFVPFGTSGSASIFGATQATAFGYHGPYGAGGGYQVFTTGTASASGSSNSTITINGSAFGSGQSVPIFSVPQTTNGGKG